MSFFEPFMCPVIQGAGIQGTIAPLPTPAPIIHGGSLKHKPRRKKPLIDPDLLSVIKSYLELKTRNA